MSVALKPETATVRLLAVAGMEKALMLGTVVSGRVMVTEAERLAETFPAASLAQAYAVRTPAPEKVKLIGAVAVQLDAEAAGALELSEIR